MLEHEFTFTIKKILTELFGDKSNEIFEKSYLIQYLNKKQKPPIEEVNLVLLSPIIMQYMC